MWVRSLVPSFFVVYLAAAIAFVATVILIATAAEAQVSVLTFHNDNGRTGQNLSETILTPTSVSSGAFGKLFSYPVDGYVYAQPLYVPSVSIPDQGVHNVVFVATEHDSVYAFDADGLSLTPRWMVSFINPSLGITTVPAGDVNNTTDPGNDIVPEIGITGTPVIDPQSGTLYVVAKTKEIVGGQAHHVQRLHALDVATGAEKFGGPVVLGEGILTAPFLQGGTSIYVSGPSVTDSSGNKVPFDAVWALNRAGLMLLNGVVYVAWASHGDSGPYHGWVTAYNAQTLGLVALFNNTPNGQLGGIWMGGGGPAADGAGNIYVSAGNGTFDVTGSSSPAYGDSVVRLDPTTGLNVADYFTPFDQANLDNNDLDLASGGVMALPDQTGTATPHMLVAGGKTGKIYLINRDNGMMGKYQQCGIKCDAVLSVTLLPSAIFSVPAYFNGLVYYQGVGDVLKAFRLANGQLSSSPVSQSTTSFGFPGATPSISANGTSNGIVWTIQVDGYVNGTPAVLHAYNALSLSQELYNSNMVSSDRLASGVKFNTPTIANGKVYVGTQTQLSVFGVMPLTTVNSHDFNADGKSDIAWRDTGGDTAVWLMNGAKVTQSAGLGVVPTGWSIVGQRDFDGDGKSDILWHDTSGDVAIWFMNGAQASGVGVGNVPTSWSIVGTGDFNGDGKGDILWRDTSGNVAIWFMNGAQASGAGVGNVPTSWSIVGTGDFNGDGKSDILWRDTSGNVAIWLMNGAQGSGAGVGNVPTSWSIVGTGDFNGDGKSDILWRDTSGNVAIWFMNGAQVTQSATVGTVATTWSIVETGDFNGDGKSDILWHDTSGNVAIWFMFGAQALGAGVGNIPTVWTIQGVNAD
jgi:hypothetical protein